MLVNIKTTTDVDCGCQTSGGEGVDSIRTAADKGGQKLAKSCGHLLCMTPNSVGKQSVVSDLRTKSQP